MSNRHIESLDLIGYHKGWVSSGSHFYSEIHYSNLFNSWEFNYKCLYYYYYLKALKLKCLERLVLDLRTIKMFAVLQNVLFLLGVQWLQQKYSEKRHELADLKYTIIYSNTDPIPFIQLKVNQVK